MQKCFILNDRNLTRVILSPKWNSKCVICNKEFIKGDEVIRTNKGKYKHASCFKHSLY